MAAEALNLGQIKPIRYMPTFEVMLNAQKQWASHFQWYFFLQNTHKNTLSSTAANTFATPTSNAVYKYDMYLRMPDCDVDLIHR